MTPQQIKAAIRDRDGRRCIECGMTADEHRARYGFTLDVHRIQPGGVYSFENCITLCRKCHGPQPRTPYRTAWRTGKFRIRIDPEIADALDRFMSSQRLAPSMTSVIELALKGFLKEEGFWGTSEEG